MSQPQRDNEEPLTLLQEGMRKVAHGDFGVQLDKWPHEPYRSIVEDFNHMSESLLNIEALRESFVSNVAHEFKTPLAYIQGYATLLQDDDLSPKKRKEYCEHINNATRRLSDIIGNLLEISNLSRPNAELDTAPFSLDEQLRHVMAILMPQIERKQLHYEVDFAELTIDANESLLEDVWTNLISNAVKYTDVGGTVSVTLARSYNLAIVTVSDTGCGMTRNQMKYAFDRFYQGEASHVVEGSGLGLAIVKSVVKKHGGVVSVQSELGRGSVFTVKLPLKRENAH